MIKRPVLDAFDVAYANRLYRLILQHEGGFHMRTVPKHSSWKDARKKEKRWGKRSNKKEIAYGCDRGE